MYLENNKNNNYELRNNNYETLQTEPILLIRRIHKLRRAPKHQRPPTLKDDFILVSF